MNTLRPFVLAVILTGSFLTQLKAGQIAPADQQLFDKLLPAHTAPLWEKDFVLVEKMKVYDFPEEQLRYPIELPPDVKRDTLKLLVFTDTDVHVIPFQLSSRGWDHPAIFFRTDLPKGARRIFRLVAGFDTKGIPESAQEAPVLQTTSNPHEAILSNGFLLLKVPAGHEDFPEGKPFAQIPPPILAAARKTKPEIPMPAWLATGSFAAPDSLRVESLDARLIESGPLFTIYEVTYRLKEGKAYTMDLELRAGESHVAIAETATGFTPDDGAFLRLDYGSGLLDPDLRLVATNGGYGIPEPTPTRSLAGGYPSHTGAYDKNVSADGKLDYCLGLFTPNALGVMHATAFYKQGGGDAILLALEREAGWKTFKRALWSSPDAFENIRFYSKGGTKYLTAGLAGSKRFWALALIPGDDVKLTRLPGITNAPPAGPEVRLFNQLNDWSLNAYKDRAIDWPEKPDAAPFDSADFDANGPFEKMSYDEYAGKLIDKSGFFQWIVNDSWDFSALIAAVSFRGVPGYFGTYAVSRASWTEEQRDRVRQVLLFLADCCDSDANQPHRSMLSGHPNFVMDVKAGLPVAAAAFPNYPNAKAWRDSFMGFYNEWLDKYDRKDVPELNTKGGRWTENIACYVGQCFTALQVSQKALMAYDGTSLGQNPQLLALIRWMRDSFMSPHDGVRMIPPEGAHSASFTPGEHFWKAFFQLCQDIARDDPQLALEMHWIETNGKEGKKPDIRSALYTDYGPVLHHDFGGEHESYAHMQNIFGLDYRWGHAGIVYYGAKNKAWSVNTMETNGDKFNVNEVTAFNVNGDGLATGPTNQLLYDFDFAQFYRQTGKETDAYRARGLMLLRDDYLVLSDEVADATVSGTFNWVSVYDLPQIYQLKPGTAAQDSISRDPQPPRRGAPDRMGKVRSYSGTGDFLTVVAPAEVKAEAASFGAVVNGEYVFASQKPVEVSQTGASFSGTYGYARPSQLALFQGTSIGLGGFELRREGGDFGVSASVEKNGIAGRIVGRSGGKIFVVPPKGLEAAKASVTIDGQAVPHTLDQGAIIFPVEIQQKDGLKNYEITF